MQIKWVSVLESNQTERFLASEQSCLTITSNNKPKSKSHSQKKAVTQQNTLSLEKNVSIHFRLFCITAVVSATADEKSVSQLSEHTFRLIAVLEETHDLICGDYFGRLKTTVNRESRVYPVTWRVWTACENGWLIVKRVVNNLLFVKLYRNAIQTPVS